MSLREAMSLFDGVVDLPRMEQQAALDSAPEGIARMVRDMLRADASSRRFGTGVGVDLLAADVAHDVEPEPDALPGYTLVRQLGRGGMGTVYEAVQDTPSRRVALKLIHPWLASERTRAWLVDEAEALGTVLHPGIPQVYALEEFDGLFVLVMELVEGRPLQEAIGPLSRTERVQLGIEIAQAVAHAHGRGLLHLDLKPDNVRVTPEGRAKVLDFGLARALDAPSEGEIAGTPGYMPPEQAAGQRLDTRTDVFALGKLLLDILAPRPGSSSDSLGVGAAPPSRMTGHRDLDAIIGRATQADAERRYRSAEALAEDLQRVLDHRPVKARPSSPWERVGLAVRRSPIPFAAGGLVAIVLIGASAISIERARTAELARVAAEEAQVEAMEARDVAEADALRARTTNDFLTEVFLLLDPDRSTGQRTLLDATLKALEKLDEGAMDDAPREQAQLRVAIAEALYRLDRKELAAKQIFGAIDLYDERDLEPDATYVDALHSAATVTRLTRHQSDSSVAAMKKAWAYLDRAQSLAESLGEAEKEAEILHSRGVWLHTRGRYAEAETVFAKAVATKRARHAEAPMEIPDLTRTLSQYAYVRMMRGGFEEAEGLWQECLELEESELARPHPRIATTLHWLAILSIKRGESEQALTRIAEVMQMRDALGMPSVAPSRSAELALRGRALADLGRFEEAEADILAVAEIDFDGEMERLGRETAWTLARALLGQGRDEEARAVVDRSVQRDLENDEGTGGWAWAYTLRGLYRAEIGEPGAREDLETALSVWEPRFTEKGPRPARIRAILETLE